MILGICWILAVLGQAFDWYTTKRGVLDMGLGEANPVIRWIFKVSGDSADIVLAVLKIWLLVILAGYHAHPTIIATIGLLGLVAGFKNRRLIRALRSGS